MLASTLLSTLAFAAAAHAHATFQEFWVNGVDKTNTCVRPPASNSPVSSVTGAVSITLRIPLPPALKLTHATGYHM